MTPNEHLRTKIIPLADEVFKEPSTRERDLALGENYAQLTKELGKLAAKFLFRGQWAYTEPEWFDHRLHLLDPAVHFNDFWTMSADNVIQVMPLGAKVLDLCCGDGFYDYWFYRYRAASITAVDRDLSLIAHASKHHGDDKIAYIVDDVLELSVKPDWFDTIIIRGAIEHFTQTQQQYIFEMAHDALKPGGWFCGDTPAANPDQPADHPKLLNAHEYEWKDEAEMRLQLGYVFDNVHTFTLVSTNRTTLFWQCQK